MNSLGSPLRLATSVPTDVVSFPRSQSPRGIDVKSLLKLMFQPFRIVYLLSFSIICFVILSVLSLYSSVGSLLGFPQYAADTKE